MDPASDASDSDEPDQVNHTLLTESKRRVLVGAPPPTARIASRPKWLPATVKLSASRGNPVYGLRMQLYCRTGFHLAIFNDKVCGLDIDQHPNAILEFSSVRTGEVQIRGVATNLFLAMNNRGRLYSEPNQQDPNTIFVEYMFGQYNTYLSKNWAHLGWYMAIKKSGKCKPGEQTRWAQKATQFLPRRVT